MRHVRMAAVGIAWIVLEWPKLGCKADAGLASKSASSAEVDPVIERQLRSQPAASVDSDSELRFASCEDRLHLRVSFEALR